MALAAEGAQGCPASPPTLFLLTLSPPRSPGPRRARPVPHRGRALPGAHQQRGMGHRWRGGRHHWVTTLHPRRGGGQGADRATTACVSSPSKAVPTRRQLLALGLRLLPLRPPLLPALRARGAPALAMQSPHEGAAPPHTPRPPEPPQARGWSGVTVPLSPVLPERLPLAALAGEDGGDVPHPAAAPRQPPRPAAPLQVW